MLQQIYLLIVDADLLSIPKFHSIGRHYEKKLHSSYRACSEINAIQQPSKNQKRYEYKFQTIAATKGYTLRYFDCMKQPRHALRGIQDGGRRNFKRA